MNQDNKHMVPMELLTRVLAGEATPDEKRVVKEWLSASEENKKEYTAIEKLWGLTGNDALSGELDIDAEWTVLNSKISPKAKVLRFQTLIRIAASIIFVLGLSYLGIEQFNYKTVKSGLAKLDNIELPDGSVISLNANSAIRYARNFDKKNRNLVLKGEGFFDVTSDKDLPFIISTDDALIEVVGTQFNVKAYKQDSEVKVSVVEGKVELFRTVEPSNVISIVAGESASFEKYQEKIEKKVTFNENDIAWKTLAINFENNTLREVVAVLENTYHYQFELNDKVKDCTITVEFKDQKLSSILKVLKSTLNIEMEQKDRTIIISGEGCIK